MQFTYPPRVSLAHLPTPIQPFRSDVFNHEAPTVFIKRDDLTGCALSGNKIRKLEFVIAEAQRQGADTLITCGGAQSNHSRATAVAAAQSGMSCQLVLRGTPDAEPDGNLLIDKMVGADITYITPEQYSSQRMEIMQSVAEQLATQDHKAFIIPEGASDALGSWGYVAATEEIIKQLEAQHITIDTIVCATGSGGTLAGLILGKALFEQSYDVIGINVCDDAAYFIDVVGAILNDFQQTFHLKLGLSSADVRIIDGYVGQGYAISSQDELAFIHNIARTTGLLLDPVYTGKTMYGLTQQINSGRFSKSSIILFVHTGGIFSLFPRRHELFSF
ncbi:D-cysteine desulfhydrase family protein [candidate division KSB1 bacterium]|nr:D-cysteine desulfhydrase family protein [candidate division KSB1 bacterium]